MLDWKNHFKEYYKWWLLNDWICISKNEKQKLFLCHRFIWDVFNGLKPEDRFIDQNNDRKDNRLENFQLLTRKVKGITVKLRKSWTPGIFMECYCVVRK